jgi:Mg-chelatase subunit ChlD
VPPTSPALLAPSPSIKAGEWDDNANYREFTRWLATEERTPFHRIDVNSRRFFVVRDVQRKPVPRCPIAIADAQQHQTLLTTTASGRAILFPHAEGLAGRDLTAIATCEGTTASAHFSLDAASDGMVTLDLSTKRTLPASRTIDVAFILDTTGSMSEEILAVKSTIQKVASSLARDDLHVRIGMVAFKDRGDEYVTKLYPMTTDLGAFQRDVSSITASGGGDTPESVNEGVHVALTKLDWGGDSVAKLAFLVGDAPPHLDYPQDFDYAVDIKSAARRGIQIFTIAASGMDDLGQVVWRQIAQYTGATNMFVLRGGAGPQSMGAGDPKSSCGGTQTAYASGKLDALILGKIGHELAAIDKDPTKFPGLRVDENAKPCNERVLAID